MGTRPAAGAARLFIWAGLLWAGACGAAVAPDPQQKPDQGPAPPLGDFVIYAQRSVRLTADETIAGSVGVHAAASGVAGAQVIEGSASHISKALIAPSVQLSSGATAGALLTNQVLGVAPPTPPTPFPAVKMPALPFLPAPLAAGANGVTIAANGVRVLKPGVYGALSVGAGGTAKLLAGDYVFAQVTLAPSARLLAEAKGGPAPAGVTVKILGGFDAQGANLIRPLTPTNQLAEASALTLFVYGGNTSTDVATGVVHVGAHLGAKTVITALLAAPHGSLAVDTGVKATGAFAAFDIDVQEATAFTFQNGFPNAWGEETGAQVLSGDYLPTHPGEWPVVGPVPLDTQMTLSVALPVAAPQGLPTLKDFIAQVSDPTQPATFRHFLNQAEFKTRYGASDADYAALRLWATSTYALSTTAYANNLLMDLTGKAGQFERAFNVFLLYRRRADGSLFVSIDRNPSLDLATPVLEVDGLSSSVVMQPAVTVNGTGVGGAGQPSSYLPADLGAAYLGGSCSALTGAGQTVGLVEFHNYSAADITLFDQRIGIPTTLPQIVIQEGGNPGANSLLEANLDVSMVQGLAPRATILVFQGSTGITGHLDSAYNAMATSNPPLTVASSSLVVKASGGEQQALDEMAAQGVTFFRASGDFGDIGDPQDDGRMGSQTLVGGTLLTTNPLTGGSPPYPNPYYVSETAWNLNTPKTQDATGGGVMNGHVARGVCFFCAGQVDIPGYQVATQQRLAGVNGGSTSARNYPDVAWIGDNAEIFLGGATAVAQGKSPIVVQGTSIAAPLWAGFAALANQQQSLNDFGATMGFLNPTLYDIGNTEGSADDLYLATFNDLNDNSTNANGWGPGFKATQGYDLVAGWGTPTCNLLIQLASLTSLTDITPLVELEFVLGTGDDNLESYSELDADVVLSDGTTTLHEVVHPHNAGEWKNFDSNNGGQPRVIGGFQVPFPGTQITRSNPIKSVKLTLVQHNSFPHTADNWDMTSLTVNAYTGHSQHVCQVKVTTISTLDDGSKGVFRFKKNFDPDCHTPGGLLCGPSQTFTGGC